MVHEEYKDFLNGADTTNAQVAMAMEDLVRSGLSPQVIRQARLKIFKGNQEDLKKKIGFASMASNPILAASTLIEFPYFGQDGAEVLSRYKLIPSMEGVRYLSPRGRPTPPYILPSVWSIFDKPHRPIWITEGEKKALKLIQHGESCIALPGVWGFKAGKSSSETDLSKSLWEELRRFDWRGRTTYLAFDSDLWTNRDVRYALIELALKLWALDANVRFPEWYKPKGIDDFIASHDQPEVAILGLKKNSKEFLSFLKPEHSAEALRAVSVTNLSPTKRDQIESSLSKCLHISKSVIHRDIEARLPKKDTAEGLDALFERYSLIYGSSEVWDAERCESMKMEAFRNLFPMTSKIWSNSSRKRIINREDIVFEPAGAAENQINMFKCWPMNPDKTKPHQKLVSHILHLCGTEDLCHWVTCWLAWPLQHPGAKMATSIVFHGGQGTGKSIFFDVMASIYGDYGAIIDQPTLESTFTGWSSRKLFVLAEEVISNLQQSNVKNRLKGMITGGRIWINKKGIEPREETNHMNMVFLSNHEIPVLIDDDDRRFVIIRIDEKQEQKYYDELAEEISQGGAAGLYDFLLHYDLKDFPGAHAKPPMTEAKMELKSICQSSVQKFLDAWEAEALPIPFVPCLTHSLYVAYCVYCKGSNEYIFNETRFGIEIKKRWPKRKSMWGAVLQTNRGASLESKEDLDLFSSRVDEYRKKTGGEKI